MEKRKFANRLHGVGTAATIRESVLKDIRENAVLTKPKLVEPVDYENIIAKNKTLLLNDPQRELLLFPHDDVSQSELPRRFRTVQCSVPQSALNDLTHLLVRESIHAYTCKWHMIHFKYSNYSGSYQELAIIPPVDTLPQHVFEVDIELEGKEEESALRSRHITVVKRGWLFKGPDSNSEAAVVSFTRSFKRRYFYLKQQADASYVLEFYKDEKRAEAKGVLFLDSATDVVKTSRRGKLSFEVHMQDKTCHLFAAESETDVDDWVSVLRKVVSTEDNNCLSSIISVDRNKDRDSDSASVRSESFRDSLEHSMNPELQKYARETDSVLVQQRKEGRSNIFVLYPEIKKVSTGFVEDQVDTRANSNVVDIESDVYKEQFGTRFLVRCDGFKLRLQTNLADDVKPEHLDNPEPFFLIFALYNSKEGRKISEDFHFDPNSNEIRHMIPNEQENIDSSTLNAVGDSLDINVLQRQKQAIFSVSQPNADIFLVVRIEKILHGSVSSALEQYLRTTDVKAGTKLHKFMVPYCQKLGHYHMPFAWGARPLFRKFSQEIDTTADFVIYKVDSSRFCEDEIIKQLVDMRRTDKQMRQQPIQGVMLKVTVQNFKTAPCVLTSSLLPIRPFEDPLKQDCVTREVEEFIYEDTGQFSHPFVTYVNHLYIHPHSLKYDGQKAFAKARNIACCIEVKDSDEDGATPLKVIYGCPWSSSLFTTAANTTVLHHNSSPEFLDEVKIALPTYVHERHHILFTFYHIGCDLLAKTTPKKGHNIENVVGYAWFPILRSGRINVGEQNIKVAINLPAGYLFGDQPATGRMSVSSDIKWVDGGRPLFKFGLFLVSTVYTKDQHLHSFFSCCQELEDGSAVADATPLSRLKSVSAASSPIDQSGRTSNQSKEEILNVIKGLHAVDISAVINFLPQLLTQLFRLLTYTTAEDVALHTIRVLVHIVQEVHLAGKSNILYSFVKYVFVTESDSKSKTLHEELAQYLNRTLRPTNADLLVVGKFLKHSWFFFEILIKSMAQYLLSTDRIKMSRNERFSSSFLFHIETLVQSLCQHIVQKHRESHAETQKANTSLAHFVKKCFTFMDRGFTFRLVNLFVENFSPSDGKVLHEYKFEFLRVICSHEHYIPLNLPMMRKQVKNFKDLKHDYTLTDEFVRNHFLVGLLLSELKLALNQIQDIRKFAITTLRNLLAKHSFDDRYSSKASQARIASLYLPLLSIIIENKTRLSPKHTAPSLPTIANNGDLSSHDTPSRPTSSALGSYNSQLSLDQTSLSSGTSSVSQQRPTVRDPNVFSLISGQALNTSQNTVDQKPPHHGSSSSLASSSCSIQSTGTEKAADNASLASGRFDSGSLSGFRGDSLASESRVPGSYVTRYDKLNQQEIKDLMLCFLYIIKTLSEDMLLGWLNSLTEYDVLDFFCILEICMELFKYAGKKRITSLCIIGDSRRSVNIPARKQVAFRNSSLLSGDSVPDSCHGPSQSEAGGMFQAVMEANLSCEVSMIVLDTLSLYMNSFKEQLQENEGDNQLMHKVLDLYLIFLQTAQSELVQKHAFAVLRTFITKFPKVLFQGQAYMCGRLCQEILRCCSSRLDTTRNEACVLMYLLMRRNFEFSNHKSFTRVHLQMIIAVSQLIGNSFIISNSRFTESLSIISSYASNDNAVQRTNFPAEAKDLTKCIRTVLMATSQMEECKNNPEMLIDLQYSLAKSYTSTPELRKTWLESMARIHLNHGNFSEAAHCYIHITALVAEFLKRRGEYLQGCTIFKAISPNVESEESGMRDDSGMQDVAYTENHLIELLEKCAHMLEKAERYELLGEIYRLIIPIYEHKRDFEKLASAYEILHRAYDKVVDVIHSGKRLLGKYFRVAFFGQSYFDEENGKEYVYKEPKITGLTEICERLQKIYSQKYGHGNVQLIRDSNKVNAADLDSKIAYIQVTHVTPYFDEKELQDRQTDFERNNNIRRFMFETPFTKDGKAHGCIEDQWRRRTIITTSHSFPYVKKRILVVYHKEEELSPIEGAVADMKSKVVELTDVICQRDPDVKKLQLKLQGAVCVQVNAGPLAYAEAFLSSRSVHKYKHDKVGALKEHFRSFVLVCSEALTLNGRLISSDQVEYHESLLKNYRDFVGRLEDIFGERLLDDEDCVSIASTSRNSAMFPVSSTGQSVQL